MNRRVLRDRLSRYYRIKTYPTPRPSAATVSVNRAPSPRRGRRPTLVSIRQTRTRRSYIPTWAQDFTSNFPTVASPPRTSPRTITFDCNLLLTWTRFCWIIARVLRPLVSGTTQMRTMVNTHFLQIVTTLPAVNCIQGTQMTRESSVWRNTDSLFRA